MVLQQSLWLSQKSITERRSHYFRHRPAESIHISVTEMFIWAVSHHHESNKYLYESLIFSGFDQVSYTTISWINSILLFAQCVLVESSWLGPRFRWSPLLIVDQNLDPCSPFHTFYILSWVGLIAPFSRRHTGHTAWIRWLLVHSFLLQVMAPGYRRQTCSPCWVCGWSFSHRSNLKMMPTVRLVHKWSERETI